MSEGHRQHSKGKLWAGRAISALPVLFLLFDGAIKLMNIQPVVESFTKLGYNPRIATTIGILELICVVIYLIPRTSLLGAILLTGYLGGAIATHLRVGDPLFSHVLFPIYIAVPVWGGLLLRNERVRTLMLLQPATAY
jgi:hypothetical protein